MNNLPRQQLHFWGLVGSAGLLCTAGLAVVGFGYATQWPQTLWHVCREGVKNLWGHAPVSWQLVILILLIVVLLRGVWSFGRQVWQTQRFARGFLAQQSQPPSRLKRLLTAHRLTPAHIVYLNLSTVHVFCLGLWRPRVWLTSGLVTTLTDPELNAVLAHEAHHLRQRDPLRLVMGRAIASAFFFLPLMGALARRAELGCELAADSAAIAFLGDDLPLLCALQKLLALPAGQIPRAATITAFNITEARLRRLLYPAAAGHNERRRWSQWPVNFGVLLILTLFGYLAVQPIMGHPPIDACTIEEAMQPLQSQLPLNEWPFSAAAKRP
ncbi:MAG: Protease HtpX [Anaerolineae bacterium]|nr:Protease HtpX [Anaerolineae bacterium]